ncbi:MAG: BamA/TamA family outer membrane protein [Gemmatimonadaceae bacterium]
MTRAAGLALAALFAALVARPHAARGQDLACDPGDLEVRSVTFAGNRVLRDVELANAVATTASSVTRRLGLPWPFRGTRRCLDSLELQRDAIRLRVVYRRRGYWHARIATGVTAVRPGTVAVAFRIAEGAPVRVDSLVVAGLDSVAGGDRLARRLSVMRGAVYDQERLRTIVDTIVERLHDNGYAHAEEPLREDNVDTVSDRADVRRQFISGPLTRIGAIDIQIDPSRAGEAPSIEPRTVRKLLSFREGDIYRERELFASQRDLYQLDAYRHVEIAPDTTAPRGDSTLTVVARLAEREMRSARAGVGWGTLDCVRAQARYTDRDFLGGARRLELNGRLSKIARGYPLNGVSGICTRASRRDPFSDTLNYYLGATYRQPALFGPRNVPTFTLYSERRSKFSAYQRTTPFGLLFSVTRELRQRTPLSLTYQLEYGRTDADNAVFCSVFNVCSLGDIDELRQSKRLGVVSASISRDRTDNPFDPGRGSQLRLEVRHASAAVASDKGLRFNKWLGDASVYRRVGKSAVLAARAQVGGVLAVGSLSGAQQFIPPQERLYGGGPNSVRGYNQNELGPVVYLVDTFTVRTLPNGTTVYQASPDSARLQRASPTGGNALLVGSVEARLRSPFLADLVQWVGFVDVGQVYNRGQETVNPAEFKWTPGLGIRVASPVGPLRLDVAYNGYPRRSGAAYYLERTVADGEGRSLFCVSPTNTLERGEGGDCPGTFAPAQSKTFFSRLTFHFSIGQAF